MDVNPPRVARQVDSIVAASIRMYDARAFHWPMENLASQPR